MLVHIDLRFYFLSVSIWAGTCSCPTLDFKAIVGCFIRVAETNVLYVPRNPPLVLHYVTFLTASRGGDSKRWRNTTVFELDIWSYCYKNHSSVFRQTHSNLFTNCYFYHVFLKVDSAVSSASFQWRKIFKGKIWQRCQPFGKKLNVYIIFLLYLINCWEINRWEIKLHIKAGLFCDGKLTAPQWRWVTCVLQYGFLVNHNLGN